MQAALTQSADPVVLAEVMPARWASFMRTAPMEQVRPLGTRNAAPLLKTPFAVQGGALNIPPPPTN